ncbi:DUF488 domain-containing protein [Candidatus Gracilibacteria bacterium]|nr:DUF488 domain-containing protein [Candidatus Gracilibacteria bacterium]
MKVIYSIGHSTRTIQEFLFEINSVEFTYLVDVRSSPYSRFVPQYNKNRLQELFGSKYVFMGDTLGGMDDDISYESFMYGIEKLSNLAKDQIVVFFCSEKDYKKCHRFYKITPELEIRGFKVIHL